MTLNGIIALVLLFSLNLIALLASYVTVVEDRPGMSAEYCVPVPVFHFWPKLTRHASRSPWDSWAICYYYYYFLVPPKKKRFPLLLRM